MTQVVNLFGGPGCGKSTTAALIFAKLKIMGVNAELVTEHAKELYWEGVLRDYRDRQEEIYAEQKRRIDRLIGKVDVIVTDSPILLSSVYGNTTEFFKGGVISAFNSYNNLNVVLTREVEFQQEGRNSNEEEAKEFDEKILEVLKGNCEYATLSLDQAVQLVPMVLKNNLEEQNVSN